LQPLADFAEEVAASPDGSEVLVVARTCSSHGAGGSWRNLTRSQGRGAPRRGRGRPVDRGVSDAGGDDARAPGRRLGLRGAHRSDARSPGGSSVADPP
jgi:hypothetical protein